MKKAMEVFKEASEKAGFIKAKWEAKQMVAEFFEDWTGDLIEYGGDSHHIARAMFVAGEESQNGVHFKLDKNDNVVAGWVNNSNDNDPAYHTTREEDGSKKQTIVTRENIAQVFAELIEGMDIRSEYPYKAYFK